MSRFAPSVRRHPRTVAAVATLAALTMAALASSTVAVAAQPDGAAPQASVYYNVTELTTDQGTHAIYRRIVTAAWSVCPGRFSRYLDQVAASRDCERQAVARAVRRIGNARLAALYTRSLSRHG